VRLTHRIRERIDRYLEPDEKPSEFMRIAIMREITRRERNGGSNG